MIEPRTPLRATAAALSLLLLLSPALLAGERHIESFDPASYDGDMGTLILPFKGNALLAVVDTENTKILRLTSANGSFQLPVGKYSLLAYVAYAADAAQEKWAVAGNLQEAKARDLTVAANATQALALGPPLTASVAIARTGDDAEITFTLTGRGGDLCVIRKTDSSTPAPAFQVVDPTGKVVWHETFKFG